MYGNHLILSTHLEITLLGALQSYRSGMSAVNVLLRSAEDSGGDAGTILL